ncbi:hypothetical protein LEP1GSC016_1968 [Leptospira borgpetersenii serovar Hardjo-bovis str. Sponselee]|uniref:Uncharacterized protein n=2 Tax=Leptospira borgpetersenii TaxID=174 RepID=M6BXR4_LEPBO|nr:hypothetical protein LEP1GSC016_1968 [Leptospira borgpetersenii serovar Hardjo-bovis str. Sponselee]EMO61221.1 hypothetical protein LEP1GSC133_0716 [Leptospira borgpetersenii serovar Pomona str. 200901868]
MKKIFLKKMDLIFYILIKKESEWEPILTFADQFQKRILTLNRSSKSFVL